MNNEQEWRTRLFEEIKELRKDVTDIRSEMHTLKLKVAGISSMVGVIVSFFLTKFF